MTAKDLDKKTRIRELVERLNEASRAYYQEGREIMPNIEYDLYYDELLALENETGYVLPDSPSVNVGYEILSELPKEPHATPMLSLNKTKSVDELLSWMGPHECVLSWKLDGITCVLTYEGGSLVKAVTRGNGEIGEIVTPNARTFQGVPRRIPYQGELVIRGEAVISYSEFRRINEREAAEYKNPRNLCSGSVRQLDPGVTAERHVRLIAFALISAEGEDFHDSFSERMDWLDTQGFETVERVLTGPETLRADIERFKERIPDYDIPSDGLVLCFEDTAYGASLGRTAKFPRDSMAFKWQDELAETTLRKIEWSASRTGLINPVAVFDSVELEGTTVSRASVHNVSIVEELALGIGDRITVYKANMIIPQISDNLTRSGTCLPPERCPVCMGKTRIMHEHAASLLYCDNPDCPAKRVGAFDLMTSRNALNIEGLSEQTLEKLIDHGFVREYADLFHLDRYREEIEALEGFGKKSADRLLQAAEAARETDCYRVLYGLGIGGVGVAAAKAIAKAAGSDIERAIGMSGEELLAVRDIGPATAESFVTFFDNDETREMVMRLVGELSFREGESADEAAGALEGRIFVITGELSRFQNRDEAKELIERLGGKVSGSVSKRTSYLVNNDPLSTSGKNKKARELAIPLISEEELIAMFPEEFRP